MAFTARSIINGKLLAQHSGQNVSILVNIEDVEGNGRMLKGTTTDMTNVRVSLTDPISAPIKSWVEVIGVPVGPDVIRCKELILFESNDTDEEFDTEAHNMLVAFLANAKDVYKTGPTSNGLFD